MSSLNTRLSGLGLSFHTGASPVITSFVSEAPSQVSTYYRCVTGAQPPLSSTQLVGRALIWWGSRSGV